MMYHPGHLVPAPPPDDALGVLRAAVDRVPGLLDNDL